MASNFIIRLRPFMDIGFLQVYSNTATPDAPKRTLIRGTVEVHGSVGAKWLRVELQKTEIVWSHGREHNFLETIGGHPVTLWSSHCEEFANLRSGGYPFQINIPNTTASSVTCDRDAAIKYELVASVMLQGKKSLFGRAPASIVSRAAPITIERYDLLQTQPVYSHLQACRTSAYDNKLIAHLQYSVLGPGDIVSVDCVQYADDLGVVASYKYELVVRETAVFWPNSSSVARSTIISKQLSLTNEDILPGVARCFTLRCQIPFTQKNVSVSTARLIEMNYTVQIKVLLESWPAGFILGEFPVTVMNWQGLANQSAMNQTSQGQQLSEQAGASASHIMERLKVAFPPAPENPLNFGNGSSLAAPRFIARPTNTNLPDLISHWSQDSPATSAGATGRSFTTTHPSTSSRFRGSSIARSRATTRSTPSSHQQRGYD